MMATDRFRLNWSPNSCHIVMPLHHAADNGTISDVLPRPRRRHGSIRSAVHGETASWRQIAKQRRREATKRRGPEMGPPPDPSRHRRGSSRRCRESLGSSRRQRRVRSRTRSQRPRCAQGPCASRHCRTTTTGRDRAAATMRVARIGRSIAQLAPSPEPQRPRQRDRSARHAGPATGRIDGDDRKF